MQKLKSIFVLSQGCMLVCLSRVSISQQPVKTICLCISVTAKINLEKTANTQEENLLYCLKRMCCICNSLYTLKNKRIERGSNINISLCVPSDSAAASFIFFPREEAFSVPLTSKDRSEVSIKIRAMNHYGSRLLQGSNCVLAESFEVRAAWYLCTSC